jgi:hypothetical protein
MPDADGNEPEVDEPPSISFEGPVQKLAHAAVNRNLTFYRRWKSSEQPLYHRRYCTLTGMELTYWHIIANNTINNSGKKKRMSSKMSHKKASTLQLKRDHVFNTTGTIGEFTISRENDPEVRLRVVGEKRAEKAGEWVRALRRACGKTEDEAALIVGHDSDAADSSDDEEGEQKLAEEADMAGGEWTRGETSISATVEAVGEEAAPTKGGRKSKRPSLLSNFKSEFEDDKVDDSGEIDLDAIGESEELNSFEEHKKDQDAEDEEDVAHQGLITMVAKETGGDPEKAEERMNQYLELHGTYAAAYEILKEEAEEAAATPVAPAEAAPAPAPASKPKLKMGGLLMKAHKTGNLEGAVDRMEAALEGDDGPKSDAIARRAWQMGEATTIADSVFSPKEAAERRRSWQLANYVHHEHLPEFHGHLHHGIRHVHHGAAHRGVSSKEISQDDAVPAAAAAPAAPSLIAAAGDDGPKSDAIARRAWQMGEATTIADSVFSPKEAAERRRSWQMEATGVQYWGTK